MKSLKRELRRAIRETIASLTPEEIRSRSGLILNALAGTSEWREADIILSFLSMPKEVDTEPIMILALEEGREIALPRMNGDELDFHFIEDLSCDWVTHEWGVREPDDTRHLLDLNGLQGKKILALVPGAAFDANCYRLGWGRGFYDRFLEKAGDRIRTAGLCFSVQLVDKVPAEPHDRPTDFLVTDPGTIYRHP